MLVNGHDSNARITEQSKGFLTNHTNGFTLVDMGHGVQGGDGRLMSGSVKEIWPNLENVDANNIRGPAQEYIQHPVVDKINSVFAGAEQNGICVSTRCFGKSLENDGLDPRVKQLVTFADSSHVALANARQNQHLTNFLADQNDINNDGRHDMFDFQHMLNADRQNLRVTIPKFEVRPSVFAGMQNNNPFIAVQDPTALPGIPSSVPAEIFGNQQVMINGQPAMADMRVSGVDVNVGENTFFQQRSSDGQFVDIATQAQTPPPLPEEFR